MGCHASTSAAPATSSVSGTDAGAGGSAFDTNTKEGLCSSCHARPIFSDAAAISDRQCGTCRSCVSVSTMLASAELQLSSGLENTATNLSSLSVPPSLAVPQGRAGLARGPTSGAPAGQPRPATPTAVQFTVEHESMYESDSSDDEDVGPAFRFRSADRAHSSSTLAEALLRCGSDESMLAVAQLSLAGGPATLAHEISASPASANYGAGGLTSLGSDKTLSAVDASSVTGCCPSAAAAAECQAFRFSLASSPGATMARRMPRDSRPQRRRVAGQHFSGTGSHHSIAIDM